MPTKPKKFASGKSTRDQTKDLLTSRLCLTYRLQQGIGPGSVASDKQLPLPAFKLLGLRVELVRCLLMSIHDELFLLWCMYLQIRSLNY